MPRLRGFEMEIQIVDHCNLNCDHCNHFANIAEPWYMSREEFEYSIRRIREEFYPYGLDRLMILGGEPLLHPEIKDFCRIARETFPEHEFRIDVLTNGIALKDMSKEDLDFYTSQVHFCITPYPNIKYSDKVRDLILDEKLGKLSSRLFFVSTNIDLIPTDTAQHNYKSCPKYSLPCYFIKNYKIYICPFSGCVHIFNKKFNLNLEVKETDYIDLRTATMESLNELRERGPQNICKHCNMHCLPIYWSNGGNVKLEDYLGLEPSALFNEDYAKYDKLFNGSELFKRFKNESYLDTKTKLIDLIDTEYCTQKTAAELNRIKGKVDIIIPYYNISEEVGYQLLNTLKRQSIIQDCHIYLISDCSKNSDILFGLFGNSGLNVTFLKTNQRSGPGGARQVGIDNSYNSTLFFLDSDDILISETGLEDMYNKLIEEQADLVSGISCLVDWIPGEDYKDVYEYMWAPGVGDTQDVHCIMYNREFLLNNNIRFSNVFITEDADFNYQVVHAQPKIAFHEERVYLYRRNMPASIGIETNYYDKLLCRILSNLENGNYKPLKERWYNVLYGDDLLMQSADFNQEKIENAIGISFFFGYQFYSTMTEEEKSQAVIDDKNTFMYLLDEQIKSNNMKMKINGRIYKNKSDYIALINQIIDESVIKQNHVEGLAKWMN